jgi:hypothetical protein
MHTQPSTAAHHVALTDVLELQRWCWVEHFDLAIKSGRLLLLTEGCADSRTTHDVHRYWPT